MLRPDRHQDVMDREMLDVWQRAMPLPSEVRLYGGTALSLYLGHRESNDFDFIHVTGGLTPEFVQAHLAPFNEGRISGGPGLVDVTIETSGRPIRVNLAECGVSFVPYPVHKAVRAPNGVPVAHIEDLIAAKLRALLYRDAPRDFQDLAECIRQVPDSVHGAVEILQQQNDDTYRLVKAMAAPGTRVCESCPGDDIKLVCDFATAIVHRHADQLEFP